MAAGEGLGLAAVGTSIPVYEDAGKTGRKQGRDDGGKEATLVVTSFATQSWEHDKLLSESSSTEGMRVPGRCTNQIFIIYACSRRL